MTTPCMLAGMALVWAGMLGMAFYLWVYQLAFMGSDD